MALRTSDSMTFTRTWRYESGLGWPVTLIVFGALFALIFAAVSLLCALLVTQHSSRVALIVTAFLIVLLTFRFYRMTPRVRLTAGGLEVVAPWTRSDLPSIPAQFSLDDLDVENAEVVEHLKRKDLGPRALLSKPVVSAHVGSTQGWCVLENGRHAHVFIGRHPEAVYLPTFTGYALLVSLRGPRSFLQAIRASQPTEGSGDGTGASPGQ